MYLLHALLLAVVSLSHVECRGIKDNECNARSFGFDSVVCVCDGSQCDTISRIGKPARSSFVQVTSSLNGLRFARSDGTFRKTNDSQSTAPRITIKRDAHYQTIVGFGGAFTDAATMNIKALPQNAQDQLLRAYFSEDGLEYNMGRVPIGGSDFSLREYTYDDLEGDANLTSFQLQDEDLQFKIPVIQRAMQLMPGPDEMYLTSAIWSSPPWMKTSHAISGLGILLSKYYQAYADYHVLFLDAYADKGIKFWGISTGNEPTNGLLPLIRFNSLGWLPSSQSAWIRDNFGPTIRRSRHKAIKILALDDQRLYLYFWLDWILQNNVTNSYVDGIAVHWYTDYIVPTSALIRTQERYPQKFLLYTEACLGTQPFENPKVKLGHWFRAEQYADNIMSVLNNWVTGWIDWNLAVNTEGGPNWAKNFADSAIIVNATSGEFYKQPIFYAIGHFSKFIPRGSVRIDADVSAPLSSPSQTLRKNNNVRPHLGSGPLPLVSAFQRPDGAVAVVLLNKYSSEINIDIVDKEEGTASLSLPPRSIATVLFA